MSIAVALLLTAALAAPAAAGEQRPISGQFTAQAGAAEPRCGDALTLGFEIRGVAAHLGALTGTGSNCTGTLTTEAVAIWDGQPCRRRRLDADTVAEAQDAPVAGVATFEVTHTITGGTGRFADPDGVWIVTGTIDFTTGMITGQVTGWLAY
jgi:hypothetical protein